MTLQTIDIGEAGVPPAEDWEVLARGVAEEVALLQALSEGREEVDAVAVVAGIARIRTALLGVQLARLADLVEQREAELRAEAAERGRPFHPGARRDAVDQVTTEVSLALRIHARTADHLVDDAHALRRLPEVSRALHAGTIGERQLEYVLHHAGRLMRAESRAEYDRRIAPIASADLPHRTRREAARLVLLLEPAEAAAREREAEARRGVEFRLGEDGMETMLADLPAAGMAAVREVMDRFVDHAKHCGDGRDVHQLRADLLVRWAGTALATGHVLPGHCPGCACPGARAGGGGEAGEGRLAGDHAGRAQPFLLITATATTLAGLGTLPAELERHGAISADWLRRLVGRLLSGGREIPAELVVTDDAGRPVTPVQAPDPHYRPRASTAAVVRRRDRTCRTPGCTHPARYGDLDHTRPWDGDPAGTGPTHPANLAVLCRGHHEEKTRELWRLAQATVPDPAPDGTGWEATGTMTVTTSTGRSYTTDPEPLPHEEPGPDPVDPPF